VKAVFDVNPGSRYGDETDRYHFEGVGQYRTYLEVAQSTVGDWAVFREARRGGGREAYVGVARVTRVDADGGRPGYYYACLEDYLPFSSLVPLSLNGRYAEVALRAVIPKLVGVTLQGRSMRPLDLADFTEIVESGLSQTIAPENATRLGLDADEIPLLEFPAPAFPSHQLEGFAETVERRVEQMLVNRKIRDANFRLQVCDAYENRCAVTGLRMINGGGRAEVQAAHIKPVALGGPDIVQNGMALSATVHWLFDRHLISIDEDFHLLVSHNRVPAELRNLFRPTHETIHLPRDRRLHPAPLFLAHHREIFAGKS
jgi:putative restriction endonuclease